MKITERKVYTCDHCKKTMLNKGAMSMHERWCGSNPENFKACSGCVHIEEIVIEYEVPEYSHEDYGGRIKKTTGFHCKKLDKKLYPTKAEKKKLPERFPETFEDQEPMPKECEHKQSEFDLLLNYRNGENDPFNF